MKTTRMIATVLLTTATFVSAPAFAAGDMGDMSDMTKALDYFHAHSFDFPQNFRFQHPGPEWFLQHEQDFKYTDKQSAELKKMSRAMFDDMKKYDMETMKAHKKYADDAAAKMPSERELKRDIQKIGVAESDLAYTMIPFHLKSYAMLTPDQKKTFDDLIAKGEGKK